MSKNIFARAKWFPGHTLEVIQSKFGHKALRDRDREHTVDRIRRLHASGPVQQDGLSSPDTDPG